MTAIAVCLAYFFFVGLLSLQSLLLNAGHQKLAFYISFIAGVMQLYAIKKMVISSDWMIIAVALSGAVGLKVAGKIFWRYKKNDSKSINQPVAE